MSDTRFLASQKQRSCVTDIRLWNLSLDPSAHVVFDKRKAIFRHVTVIQPRKI